MWYKCQGWGVSPLKGMSTIKEPMQRKKSFSPAVSQPLKLYASVCVCVQWVRYVLVNSKTICVTIVEVGISVFQFIDMGATYPYISIGNHLIPFISQRESNVFQVSLIMSC